MKKTARLLFDDVYVFSCPFCEYETYVLPVRNKHIRRWHPEKIIDYGKAWDYKRGEDERDSFQSLG